MGKGVVRRHELAFSVEVQDDGSYTVGVNIARDAERDSIDAAVGLATFDYHALHHPAVLLQAASFRVDRWFIEDAKKRMAPEVWDRLLAQHPEIYPAEG